MELAGTFLLKNLIKLAARMMHGGTTRSACVSTEDLFQRRSIDLRLGGRYSLASRYDTPGTRPEVARPAPAAPRGVSPCRTSRVSPSQMHISVPVLGPVGERVVTYFGDFGNLDG